MTEPPPAESTQGEPGEADAAAGRVRPALADPHPAAQTGWAAVHGVASLHIARGGDPCSPWAPLDDRTAAAVDGIPDGLLAAPTRRSR